MPPCSDDADKMLAFYRDVIGLEMVVDYTWPEKDIISDRITALSCQSCSE